MKRKINIIVVNAVLSVFILAIYSGYSKAETIIITGGEWSPYLTEQLKFHGIAGRIITEVFSQAGIKVDFRFLPWKRAYEEAKKGRVDGTAVWLKKPEREKIFHYSDEVIVETHVFFFKKGLKFDWKTVDDLKPYNLGGLIGFSYGSKLDKALEEGKIKMSRVAKDEHNFNKLLKGRIDLYPQEINVSYELLYKSFLRGEVASIDHHPKPFMTNPSYLLLPKKRPGSKRLQIIFNKGLAKIRNNGKIDEYIMEARKGAYAKSK